MYVKRNEMKDKKATSILKDQEIDYCEMLRKIIDDLVGLVRRISKQE